MKTFNDIGIQIPSILLPKKGSDLSKWAVIACDQFTSEPEYWQKVETLVGEAPSTYKLIFPEVYLEKPGEEARIRAIHERMRKTLQDGTLVEREGLIYVERTINGKTRRGLMVCLDLECYDFSRSSTSLVRATEGTIVERLPPRMKIRTGAELELPHILVLIDDPGRSVIEPVGNAKASLEKLYDFELMLGSGHLNGYAVNPALEDQVVAALRRLADPQAFSARYGLERELPVLLFAMGDGNHSLATAKAVWEKLKPEVGMEHPARYALIELENIHDEGLEFEPIHRVLFDLKKDLFDGLKTFFGADYAYTPVPSVEEMVSAVDRGIYNRHILGVVGGGRENGLLEIANPTSNLPVGSLQAFLDSFMQENGAGRIDYIHGGEPVFKLGARLGNAGFYVPGMRKPELFKTVILDGALPRKTFSMGAAREKRFYMEARKIV